MVILGSYVPLATENAKVFIPDTTRFSSSTFNFWASPLVLFVSYILFAMAILVLLIIGLTKNQTKFAVISFGTILFLGVFSFSAFQIMRNQFVYRDTRYEVTRVTLVNNQYHVTYATDASREHLKHIIVPMSRVKSQYVWRKPSEIEGRENKSNSALTAKNLIKHTKGEIHIYQPLKNYKTSYAKQPCPKPTMDLYF